MNKNKNEVILRGSFEVEYSNCEFGYSPYIRVSLYRPTPLLDFIAYIRRNLCGSPTWVRKQVGFQHFNARFWFRVRFSNSSAIQFYIDISSAELNTIHGSREAAL